MCAESTRQSPIDLRDGIAVDLAPVQFDYGRSGFRIRDTGNTLQVEVGEGEARCRLLLGVTAQQVSVLHQLPAGPADASPATDALPVDAAFRRLLEGWRRSGPVQPVRENDHAS